MTFVDGASTTIATVTLSGGMVRVSISTLSLGSHSITAHYAGDATFDASVSAPTSVFIGVTGNGEAAAGAQPVQPQGPTGGPVASNAGAMGSVGSPSGSASMHDGQKPSSSSFNLALVLIFILLVIGLVGGTVYALQRREALTRNILQPRR